MSKCRFLYNNLWASAVLGYSTQHPHFPATNSQHRDFTKPWRSRYGPNSDWGYFLIDTNNCKLDFDEGGGELGITITPGVYNITTLCAQIGGGMTNKSATSGNSWTYVCSYSDSTNKFKIEETSGPNNFSLLWKTGTHGSSGTGRTIGDTIGYDEGADDSGASNYIADYIRIHTEEYLETDFGSSKDIYGAIIKKHNFQTSGTIQIWGSNASDYSTGIKLSFNIQDDILVLFWDSPYQFRYWRFYIQDRDNPDGYVEMGLCFLGPEFKPTRYFSPERIDIPVDPSLIKRSEGGQVSTIQRVRYFEREYEFQSTNQKSEFEALFESVGISKGFFFCEDTDNPLTKTFYVQFIEWEWDHIAGDKWNLFISLEKLR